MSEIRVLFVTIEPDKADDFAKRVVQERLVACANILPGVRSHYWWQGELCSEGEAILFMETPADRADAVMQRLHELHPYDCPKLVALDPASVNEDYAAWVREQATGVTQPTDD